MVDQAEYGITSHLAYVIHTELGNLTTGAKISGKLVPLNALLKNGDVCEIITSGSKKKPSQKWLEFIVSNLARSEIKKGLKDQQTSATIYEASRHYSRGINLTNKIFSHREIKQFMDPTNLPDEKSSRFLAVLNKKIETGRLMNALGHMTAGLAGKVGNSQKMCFLEYKDKDGGVHPGISHFPFIILAADNSNQIRAVRNETLARKIPFTDFTSTMTVGTSQQQVNTTTATPESGLEYYGICLFGPTQILREFTGRLSLFK